MKLQYLTLIFVIIMLPIVLVLSQYVGIQVDVLATKTKLDTSLLGATYDTMAAYELNTRNISTSSVVGEDIREIEAVISTFTRSLSSSMGLTGVANDYILSYIPAIAFCMYDGYYIYMPNEPVSGSEKLQPYVYYTKNYISEDKGTNITIAYSLDNYVSIYGVCNGATVSAAGYLVVPDDVEPSNDFSYIVTTGEDGSVQYKVVKGSIKYKRKQITKETLFENKTVKGSRTIMQEKKETTEAMIYYYQAKQFTSYYNSIIKILKLSDKTKLEINNDNDPENEASEFNNEKVNVIKDAITSNLNRAIYNFEGVNKDTYEMPQLNGEDWDKVLNNISIIAFMKDMPLNNATVYNNYVVVNSTITQKYTSAKSIKFIGYDSGFNSKGYYHKVTCTDFLNDIKNSKISNIIGYAGIDFERYKEAVENDRDYFYYYKHNEYADYECEIKPKESVNISTLHNDLLSIRDENGNVFPEQTTKLIEQAYYTAIGRIRFRQPKASSYINLEDKNGNNFTVKYNLNGGQWGSNSTSVRSEYNRVKVPMEEPTITTGKYFIGWNIEGSTTGELIKAGDIIYGNSGSTLKLKAQYGDAYKVIYYKYDENNNEKEYETQTKLENVNLELIKIYPEKSGSVFKGWNAIYGTNTKVYNVKDINNIQRWIYTENMDVKLYPIYDEELYTIKYIDEKGNNTETIRDKRYGDIINIKWCSDITGAKFEGWETPQGEKYGKGMSISVKGDLTLYAKWSDNKYTVIFDKNDGSGEQDERTVYYTSLLTKPIFYKEGYGYNQGWSLTKNGNIDEKFESYISVNDAFIEEYFSNGNNTITVYAVWSIRAWTLTYADDSGATVSNMPTKTEGILNVNTSKYTITIDKKNPQRTNYEFTHWIALDGTEFFPGQTYYYDEVQSDLTVYAVWKRTKITITYYSDENKTKSKQFDENMGRIKLKTEEEAIKMGFQGNGILLHWRDKDNNYYEPGYSINLYDNIELYPVWTEVDYAFDYYMLYYEANLDVDVYNLPTLQVIKKGETATISTDTPSAPGYKFKGWTDVPGGTEVKNAYSGGKTILLKGNLELYAVWERKIETYTVQYMANILPWYSYYYGEDYTEGVSNLPNKYSALYGTQITIQGNPPPERAGYIFKGWTTASGGTIQDSKYDPGNTLILERNLTLYAVWERVQYKITYHANVKDYVFNSREVYLGGYVTISNVMIGNPGYKFIGWTDNPEGTEPKEEYKPESTISLNSNLDLYAVWKSVCTRCKGSGQLGQCYGRFQWAGEYTMTQCEECGGGVYARVYECWQCGKKIYKYTCENRWCGYSSSVPYEHLLLCSICKGTGYTD